MNKTLPILIVTTLGASFACLHLVHELRQERARSVSLQSQLDSLQAQAAVPASSAPTTETAVTSSETDSSSATEAASSSGSESSGGRAEPLPEARPSAETERDRLQDPTYRDAMQRQLRAGLSSLYPGLAIELGLSSEQAARLYDLLATQQVETMELSDFDSYSQVPDAAALQEHQRRSLELNQRQETELEIHLGPSTHRKWVAYQQTLGERHLVAGLQSTLGMAGVPMSEEQTKAALGALTSRQGVTAGFTYHETLSSGDQAQRNLAALERQHQQILSALKSTLTSEQYEHLERRLADELEITSASSQLHHEPSVE